MTCGTAILIPHTVEDFDAFVEDPDSHLLSISAEPLAAARLWTERLKRNSYGGEGLVSIVYYGHDLIDPSLLDHVTVIWEGLIESVEAFLAGKDHVEDQSGQPVDPTLRRVPAGALFTVAGATTLVDPAVFIPGLLDGAADFSKWVHEYLGTGDAPTLERIECLRSAWDAARHTD